MRRLASVTWLLALGVLSAAAAPVLAKEGIVARLDAPLPIGAPPGERVTISWTLVLPGGGGLTGTAVVLRIYPGDGGPVVDTSASEDPTGHWSASPVVPPGGIRTVGIGIPGTSCIGSVCSPAIDFFTVTDPSGLRVPPSLAPPATDSKPRAASGLDSPSMVGLLGTVFAAAFLASNAWRRRSAAHRTGERRDHS